MHWNGCISVLMAAVEQLLQSAGAVAADVASTLSMWDIQAEGFCQILFCSS
jgi:hypothetical protein